MLQETLDGVKILKKEIYSDDRGYFTEFYKNTDFNLNVINKDFKQTNISFSKRGVLRGLHYQIEPFAQDKLITVISGKIFDVSVDLRFNSPTFLDHMIVELDQNNYSVFIPVGFAHGFLAFEDSHIIYQTTNIYDKLSERSIYWNDQSLKINWPVINPILSNKDRFAPKWETSEIF